MQGSFGVVRGVGSAPFVGWTNGLSPWFEIKKKKKANQKE